MQIPKWGISTLTHYSFSFAFKNPKAFLKSQFSDLWIPLHMDRYMQTQENLVERCLVLRVKYAKTGKETVLKER